MFADRLQAAMTIRGYTQGMLAARTKHLGQHVAQGHISRLMKGETVPSIDTAAVIADALDVSLDWLAGRPPKDKEELLPDEEELLHAYRQISDDRIKALLLNMAKEAPKDE
jgi:transcriptional regulator with XRE-family HTH domain